MMDSLSLEKHIKKLDDRINAVNHKHTGGLKGDPSMSRTYYSANYMNFMRNQLVAYRIMLADLDEMDGLK